jgi:cobalt-zinc-cadmium efflux system membrane fusion protein
MSHTIIDAPDIQPARHPNSPSTIGRSVQALDQVQVSNQDFNATPRGPVRRVLSLILGSIGPSLVLVGFAAVFYFGHHNDWKIPKFAALTGTVEPVISDWCEEHSVPESICVQCDPTLMPKGPDYGWCPRTWRS